IGSDSESDLAVLKITLDDLPKIEFGISENVMVGDIVLAIGNPFGVGQTVTQGIASAVGRNHIGLNNINSFIQTDAAINPGNSGGPLLNSKGELVGVNTIIVSSSGTNAGVGFALPVNTVKDIIPQLIKHGRIMRPIIGITTVQDSIARRYRIKGVIIYQVPQGSNADKAGMVGVRQDNSGNISLGDIITKVDQYPIQNQSDLFNALEEYKPGDTVTLETVLGNRKRTYKIQLTKPE
ncbi:MAG: PDZ domain-containing protein, partial [Deltaproteobacteria bacterium]|nr:PDZ domain-containing protein [Deltaproteobacteria bacterium]